MELNPEHYFNRELSWLEFNVRVLGEARDATLPLLERLKFLAITSANLDEFFKVRVGGLNMLANRGVTKPDPSGLTPAAQLKQIGERTQQMVQEQMACFLSEVEPGLNEAGIRRRTSKDLSDKQLRFVKELFRSEIHAVLTPMRAILDEEFPLLVQESLSVCVRLTSTETDEEGQPIPKLALIPFNSYSLRFVTLPSDGGYEYILLEEIVSMFADEFFAGETIEECVPFRLTRNADVSLREDQAADLMTQMEDLLEARKEGECIRLEISDDVSTDLIEILTAKLELPKAGLYRVAGPLDMSAFWELVGLSGFEHLKIEDWPPQQSAAIGSTDNLFELIAEKDILLYHPYESFQPVIRFIEQAANDPDVLAIKQTLYRTSRNSPIVEALMNAAKKGKYVTAVVELKARFDEARNIEWAKNLEQAGVQVIYGVQGLKTHAKVCVVVRREPQGIRRYMHFGTGNYNEATARLYSDASLFTSDDELGADATSFMYAITGYSQPHLYSKLEAAPTTIRTRLIELIDGETERKKQGQKAEIIAKVNTLVDPEIIEALYRASRAGVKIRLNIRGACALRPGVKDLSENIQVISIIDRFLEHARVLYFHQGGDDLVYISSADWMPRNLDRRLELMVPVEDNDHRNRLLTNLKNYFRDNVKSHELKSNGKYKRLRRGNKTELRSQDVLYRQACEATSRASQTSRTVFQPHQAPGSDSNRM
ncbi:MAG: polyphosphate kinase 1 [Planctomycetaceae bacterium]|jgi:polyphosphate kinase|nr:polyphosphate kinase 1 [Planctomycetaceae bacterium]MDG2388538.1 polyphosphate kinase 1 [Planctomycetaceae bacterium]